MFSIVSFIYAPKEVPLGDGPEHQRIRQDKHDGASVNYTGAQEVDVSGTGAITIKTYLPQGIGVEIDRATGNTVSTEVNYVHHDRLGSPVAITDQAGNVKERMAYDAWGKRRSTDGSATPNTLDGIVDNCGFTNHEMLDHLDLVHMNGRVYEPLLGKFLSADPILQDPMNGQSYNRYAYVFNNPTNLTDPTGFETQGTQCRFGSGSGSCAGGEGRSPLPDQAGNKANSQAAKTEKSDGKGNTPVDAKKPGATIGPITPTLAQRTIEGMKSQGGIGLVGAVLLEDTSRVLGTAGITRKNGESYDYLADSFGCKSADCKAEALASVLSWGLGFVAPGASNLSKGGGVVAAKEAAAVTELTAAQLKNVERFMGKVPANAKESLTVRALPNEGFAAQAVSPGRVPGSSAVYEKQIDATGKTIQYTKTTYDPAGNIVHVKDKINNRVFP
jgi:RHS repeat-associated protein